MKNKRVIALFLATTLLISPIQQVYAENVSDSGITDNTESTDELQESTNEVESPKEGDNLSEKENDNTQQDGNPEGNSSDEKKLEESEAYEEKLDKSNQQDLYEAEDTDSLEETSEETADESERPDDIVVGDYIESNLDYNTPVYTPEYETYSSIPSSFPESMDEITAAYPSNRDQNPYGTCWAFSALGLAEFDLINDSLKGNGSFDKNIDLSELHLAYFTYNSVLDPLGGTEGDSAKYYNEKAQNSYLNYGGNYAMAARRLAQWYGPVKESLVPYNQAASTITDGLSDSYAYENSEAHLENTYLINIRKNANDVKQQIMEHGAVGVMYQDADKYHGWNDALGVNTYYDTDTSGGGHAVMIIGWDDNFSQNNFTGAAQPSQDGAWLVRNSWGIYQNYFWMSYETTSLADTAWVFDFSADDEYDNNYQVDGGLLTYPDTKYKILSNVFKAKQSEENTTEKLNAVSLSFTSATGVGYTIEIYTDLTDKTNPYSGVKQESATTSGTTSYAGVYTIPLENAVSLKSGSTFAVVVKLDTAVLDYEQAMSIEAKNDSSNIIWDCKVSQYNNKSFFFSGNKFYMHPWGNYCIKAFTTESEDEEQEKIEGLQEKDGGLYYFKDGVVDTNYTGTAKYQDTIYYCENGQVKYTYTGFGKYEDQWYYFEKSTIDEEKEDIIYNTVVGEWWYVKDGVLQSKEETIAHNANGWFYVKNGVVDFDFTGVSENSSGIYYCQNGQVKFAYTGFGQYNSQWYYFENSMVATQKEDIIYNATAGEWWYVKDGVFQPEEETIAHNANGWFYVKNGVVDFDFTGVSENSSGIYYCQNGQVTFSYTGFGQYKEILYYFRGSSVARDVTGVMYSGEKGWIYVKEGVYDPTYTGFASNGSSTWYFENGVAATEKTGLYLIGEECVYLTNGQVDTRVTGFYELSGTYYYVKNGRTTDVEDIIYNASAGEWWYVKDGVFQSDTETIAHNANGWFYVKNGVVDFDFTGVSENSSGIYYCQNGQVKFAYTGFGEYNGQWYYFENSIIATTKEDIIYNVAVGEWWYVKEGKFQNNIETIAHNVNGWFYVKNGIVDFDFTGVSENSTGIYYCQNGQVTFSYTGYGKYKNQWYYFRNSAVVRACSPDEIDEYQGDLLSISSCTASYTDSKLNIEINVGADTILAEMSQVYIIQLTSDGTSIINVFPATYENQVVTASISCDAREARSCMMNYYAAGIYSRMLNSYQQVSVSSYIMNPEDIAEPTGGTTNTYAGFYEGKVESKKGMQGKHKNATSELGIQATLENIELNTLIKTSKNVAQYGEACYQPYVYKGKTYYFHDMISYQKTMYELSGWGTETDDEQIIYPYGSGRKNVSLNLLLSWDDELTYLIAPSARIPGKNYYALNMSDSVARETFEALFCYMTEKLGGSKVRNDSAKKFRVCNWILGNEVNACNAWNYAGGLSTRDCADNYAKAFQLLYQAVRSTDEKARVFISLDHSWAAGPDGHSGREYLDEFAAYMYATAPHMRWNVDYHPYSNPLYRNDFWNDYSTTTDSEWTPYISMRNLYVLTNYLTQIENRYNMPTTDPDTGVGGYIRVILGEQGYIAASSSQEYQQAAAIAYEFYIASMNTRVDAVINRAYIDAAEEGIMTLGLMYGNEVHKASYELYKHLGKQDSLDSTAGYAGAIGASRWENLLPGLTTDSFYHYVSD